MTHSSFQRPFLRSLSRFIVPVCLLLSAGISQAAVFTYTVGASGTYPTIGIAYSNVISGVPGDNYIIQILPDYANTETKPITFTSNNAGSVLIYPAAGVTNLTMTSAATGSVFNFNGASNITLDGRVSGTGAPVLTIQNTNTTVSAGSFAVVFNNASLNTVKFCTLKGSNPSVNTTIAGVVGIGGGNSNITLDNCTIQAAATNKPSVAINSYSSLGTPNNTITVSNCNLVDFTVKGIWVSTGGSGWTIQNNSFYQTATIAQIATMEMIFINNGSGYTIRGNYLGGRAPNCGSGAYTLTTSTYTSFKGIYFSGSSGSNTVQQNTIQNFSISGGDYSNIYGFSGIYLRGAGTFTLGGSAGEGNTIGSLSTANSIIFTNLGATTGVAGFAAIVDSAALGSVNQISYNNIGGIQINTNYAPQASDMIMISNGIAVVDNNIIGSTAAPITHTNIGVLSLINNTTNNVTITNNTLQGVSLTNTANTSALYGIRNSGNGATITCANNTISSINSASNSPVSLIGYIGSGNGLYQNNTIHTITLTNTGTTCGLNALDINSSGTTVVKQNTIGNASPNSILVAGNKVSNMIQGGSSGTFYANGNRIQNVSLTSGGTSCGFIGIGVPSAGYTRASLSANIITIIDVSTTNVTGYGAIYCSVISTGDTITGNTISSISFSNATGVTINNGVYIGSAAVGYGGVVQKNIITDLSNRSTTAGAKASGISLGGGQWTIQNNVILLDNSGGAAGIALYGIELATSSATAFIYHNTVKLSGTQTGALGSSAIGATGTGGTFTVKNNIFQNLRSGGTGLYYAENYGNGPTVTTNNNYLEAGTLGKKAGTNYTTIASWNAAPVNANLSVTGTTTLDATGKVTSTPFAGAGAGASPAPVPDDFTGAPRNTYPWMGAYEGLEILTSPVSPPTMCAGANIIVSYIVNGTVNGSNIFTAQLSDATGNFAAPVTIGSSTSNTGMGVTIPTTITTSATGYRIRIISSSPAVLGAPNNAALTINALPTITPIASFSVCADVLSSPVSALVGGSATGVTWTTNGSGSYSNPNIVNPVYTYTAAEKSAGSVKLTATTTGGSCGSVAGSTTITFTTVPTVTTVSPATAICSGDKTNIILNSAPTGATVYSWSRATVAGITQTGTSGSANPVAETLTNTSTAAVNVTYVVTATLNGCTGTKNIVQTVNVAPTVTAPGAFSVCSNVTASTLTATLTNASGILWSTSGTGSFSPSATSPSPDYTYTAADKAAGSVTLTATATGIGSCPSASDAVTITIKPIPVLNASAAAICSGTSTSIALTTIPVGAASYAWTRATVTGITQTGSSGTANPIAETLTNSTASAVNVTYSITPTLNGCTGTASNITQTVNPLPTINTGADQTICTSQNTASFSAAITGASGVSWTTSGTGSIASPAALATNYTFTAAEKSAGTVTLTATTTGSAPCTAVSDNVIVTFKPIPTVNAGVDQTVCNSQASTTVTAALTNASSVIWSTTGTGTFTPSAATVNPTYTFSAADKSAGVITLTATTTATAPCAAVSDNVVITLAGVATISAGPDQTLCANQTGASLTATTSAPGVIWSVASGTGTVTPATSLTPTYAFTAADKTAGSVILTVTTTGTGSCPAVSDNVTVTLKAVPTINTGVDLALCASQNTTPLNATLSNASGLTWTTTGTGSFSSTTVASPIYTFSGPEKTAGSVTVTATTTGTAPCPAVSDNVVITLTPQPTVNAGADQAVCSNVSTASVTATKTNAAGVNWTTAGNGSFSPATALNAVYTFGAADIAAGTVTLTVTTTGSGACTAVSDNIVITLKAVPTVNPVAAQTICSGTNAVINLSSPSAGASFAWSVTSTGTAAGATAGTGALINQTLNGDGSINYIATATLNGCTGASTTITANVSTPVISPAALTPAIQNSAYTQTFTVTNLSSPVWSFAGTGPAGFTITSAGVFSGSTASTTTQIFTIKATNGSCTVTQLCSLAVSNKPPTTWNGTTWDNGAPDATTDAILAADYTTTSTETFTANNITVNSGSTFNITGTATVNVSGNLNNNGAVKQACTATINGTKTGTAVVIQQPILTPFPNLLTNGTVTTPYSATFTLSIFTNPSFTTSVAPPGFTILAGSNPGTVVLSGTPSAATTYSVVINSVDGTCKVSSTMQLKINDLTNPNLKFVQPAVVKTYGDAPFLVAATSNNNDKSPIVYSIRPDDTTCVRVDSVSGLVTIKCVNATDVWVRANQKVNGKFRKAVDSMRIVVNQQVPVVTLLTHPGLLINTATKFRYELPPGYAGTSSFSQTSDVNVATVDPLDSIITTSNKIDTFAIDVTLDSTQNFAGITTSFTFIVYNSLQPPEAVADTVVLVRHDGIISDGSVNLLKNDRGTTGYLRVNLTDIDIVNPGNQSIYYAPSIGTFDLDPQTGILTVHPTKGLTGTARIGYTITDSNNVTSDVAYVTLRIEDTQDLPDLKANAIMTPNSDGKNDALFIGYTDINMNNNLSIIDEAGNTVYKTENYRNDWLGTDHKGHPVEAGVYYFIFNEEEGLNRELKGFVQVVR